MSVSRGKGARIPLRHGGGHGRHVQASGGGEASSSTLRVRYTATEVKAGSTNTVPTVEGLVYHWHLCPRCRSDPLVELSSGHSRTGEQ